MDAGVLKIIGIFAAAGIVVTLAVVSITQGPGWITDTINWVKSGVGM